jgi:hypothetical protein
MPSCARWAVPLAIVVLCINLGSSAEAQGRFPPDDVILAEVRQSALEIQGALDQIDLTKLPLKYSEGELLEERRQLVVQWLRRVAEKTATLKRTGLLADHLHALIAVMELDENVSSLISSLASPITYSETEAAKTSLAWARKLLDSRKALNMVLAKLQSAVRDAVVRADALLARCGGTLQ